MIPLHLLRLFCLLYDLISLIQGKTVTFVCFKKCFSTNRKSSGYGHVRSTLPALFAMDAQTSVDCVMLSYWHLGQCNNHGKTEDAVIGHISWAPSVSLSGLAVRARSDFFPDCLFFQNELAEAAESPLHLFFL